MNLYIFIDDTGSSNNKVSFDFIADIDKIYVGYAIEENKFHLIDMKLQYLKKKHQKSLNSLELDEFHFVDIYQKNYNKIKPEKVKEIFKDFSNVLVKNDISVFTQSHKKNPEEIDNEMRDVNIIKLLLQQINEYYFKQNMFFDEVLVAIDSGLDYKYRNLIDDGTNYFKDCCDRINEIEFHKSSEDLFIQLADYCAYGYTRQLSTASKESKKQQDGKNNDEFNLSIYTSLNKAMHQIRGDYIAFINGKTYDEINAKGKILNTILSNIEEME